MRIKVLVMCLIGNSLCGSAYGQLWQSVGNPLNKGHFSGIYNDTLNDRFFGFGAIQVYDSTGTGSPIGYQQVLELTGASWSRMDTTGFGRVQDMIWYKGHYYACGPFQTIGSSTQRKWARYDNNQWNSMPVHPDGTSIILQIMNDTLYVGGAHVNIGSIYSPGIAKFDGTNFYGFSDTLGTDIINSPIVEDMVKYKGDWVIGGNFNEGSHLYLYDDLVIRKNGKNETPKNWQTGFQAQVYALAVYKGELYVGGRFFKADGSSMGNNILKWDGENWHELGTGCNEAVWDLHVYHDELIVAGWFSACDGVPANYIARWNGERWCNFTGDAFSNTILDMDTYHDTLYIAGGFEDFGPDSATYIAKWTGGDSSLQCGPVHRFSVAAMPLQSGIDIYPNPASKKVTLRCTGFSEHNEAELKLLDPTGKIIRQFMMKDPEIEMDLSGLHSGIYLLQLEYKGCVKTYKLIKK